MELSGVTSQAVSKPMWQRILFWVSIVWIILSWRTIGQLLHRLDRALIVLAGGFVTEVAFTLGLIFAASVVAGEVFIDVDEQSAGWTEKARLALKRRDEVVCKAMTRKWGRRAIYLHTAGALGTGILIFIGAVMILPPRSWPGAFVIGALDIAATFARLGPTLISIHRNVQKEAG